MSHLFKHCNNLNIGTTRAYRERGDSPLTTLLSTTYISLKLNNLPWGDKHTNIMANKPTIMLVIFVSLVVLARCNNDDEQSTKVQQERKHTRLVLNPFSPFAIPVVVSEEEEDKGIDVKEKRENNKENRDKYD
ncbi:unnamed protein product [Ceutorhynchus assimilis]|uniref:Uncharacterized protein n=1 Tax=Ceutorhynchus assimilis TaxID=467358 RepID=A0A9N9MDZ2_9CUCU|nr:unnamed protein product [Ceutorhynchus assimilis]